MTGYYEEFEKQYVALDCIIFGFDEGKLKLLLLKRNFEPSKGQWSLMGGFLTSNESLDDGARRILCQLTGLTNIYMEQLYTYGNIDRDPGERTLSVSYFALIKISDNDRQLSETHGANWIPIDSIPPLIFDHEQMVSKALKTLQSRILYKPVGFELLPEKFTLPQLQALYEAINLELLDKRNFRKQILETGLLEKLNEKEKETSKKGAYYYRFNYEKYKMFAEMGFLFKIKIRKDQLIKNNSKNL